MKVTVLALACALCFSAAAAPEAFLSTVDSKVYSLKTKGVREFVVDVHSSRLLRQVNDQAIFGKVNSLIFRVYWTATPERLALEVLGLPEGFKEIKEELKLNVLSMMDNLLPIPTPVRFSGYKLAQGPDGKTVVATDATGLAPIPSFELKYDGEDRLTEVVGKKPIGTFVSNFTWEKASDAKWALASSVTKTSESGQTLVTRKKLEYGNSGGTEVLTEVLVSSEHVSSTADAKPLISEEKLQFKNYQINKGEGLKYFLGDAKAEAK